MPEEGGDVSASGSAATAKPKLPCALDASAAGGACESPWPRAGAGGAAVADRSRLALGVAEAIADFLEGNYGGLQTAAKALVDAAVATSSDVICFYGVPAERGAFVAPEEPEDTPKAADLRLLASSPRAGHALGSEPLADWLEVVAASMCGGLPAAPVEGEAAGVAAVAVRAESGTLLGVLLVAAAAAATASEGNANMEQGRRLPEYDARDFDVRASVRLWALLLRVRLERMRQAELTAQQRQEEDIRALSAKIMQVDTVEGLVRIVNERVVEVMRCEIATMYLLDEARQEIWAPPKSTLPKGLYIPIGRGCVGHVAAKALETMDFNCSVIYTNDPKTCPYWLGDPDPAAVVTRNLISAPIMVQKGSSVLGVVQVMNKHENKAAGVDSEGWSLQDVRFMETIAMMISQDLERLLLDKIQLKARMDSKGAEGIGSAMLKEYYNNQTGKEDVRTSAVSMHRSNSELRGSGMEQHSAGSVESTEFDMRFQQTDGRGDEVDGWHINYWSLSEADEYHLFLASLRKCDADCDALEKMGVSNYTLYQFFGRIKEGYQANPYHCFLHGLASVHYSYKLFSTSRNAKKWELSDKFALLTAALCHDVGHRGFNAAYEIITRSDIALRYNDLSPLENLHCATTFEIALSGGDGGDCNIFRNLKQQVFKSVRERMVGAILATDMQHHGAHVKKVRLLSEDVDLEQQELVEVVLHMADIANPFMPPDVSAKWNMLLAEEYTSQVAAEKMLGLPVTAFMDGLTAPVGRAKSLQGFIDFVVIPFVDPLFRLNPGWAQPKAWLAANRQQAVDVTAEAVRLAEVHVAEAEA